MGQPEKRRQWIREALERFQEPLTRYALRITGNRDQARDIVQETFLRLCRQEPTRVQDRLGEWLFTVCRNRALSVRKKESRMTPLNPQEAETRPGSEIDPVQRMEREDSLGRVLRVLESLPERQQEVVRLKFQNGFSYKEIGRVTQLSVSNVGFLLHTALKRIRQELEAEGKQGAAALRRIQ